METPSTTPCTCPECGKEFTTSHNLRQHMQLRGHGRPELMPNILEAADAVLEAAPAAADEAQEKPPWDTRFLALLAASRCTSHMPRDTAQELKAHVAGLVSELKAQVAARLGPSVWRGVLQLWRH